VKEYLDNLFELLKPRIMRFFIICSMFLAIVTLQGITDQREVNQIVFMLSMISLFSLFLKNVWVTLFVLWTVFLYSFFKFTSGSEYLSNIFFGSILYLITKKSFKRENINLFLECFLWFVFINIAYGVIQVLGYDFVFHKVVYDYSGEKEFFENMNANGFMGHQSIVGYLYASAIPVLATRGSKVAWLGAFLMFIPLVIIKTSLCFLTGVIGLMFVLYFKISRKIWIGLVVVGLIFGVVYLKKVDPLGTERFVQWHQALADYMKHPITGWGLDSYRNVTPMKDFKYMQTSRKIGGNTLIAYWDNPHNLIVSLLYEFGIFGLVLFILYMRQNILRFIPAIKDKNTLALAGFILAFVIVSMGHFPIMLARCAAFIIPLFALYEVHTSA